METLFARFVMERRYLKNVAANTVCWYWESWRALGQHIITEAGDLVPSSELAERIGEVRERGVSAISVNTWARAINAYLRWAHDEGHLPVRRRIPKLKETKRLVPTLTAVQIDALLRWKPHTFGGRRLYALVGLLLDTGLRVNEAFELRRADINLDGLLIAVQHGKGGKGRTTPMSVHGRKLLVRWLALHDFDRVFPSRDGRKLGYRDSLRDLKTLGQRLGINGVRMNFHLMRHSFATCYTRSQGNLFALARILGHASTATTEKYLQSLGVDDLRAVHDKLSPLAR